jgi:predicted MFS family arabinose efflux permease
MLPLGIFRRRNFAVGNLETLVMYGGLSVVFFLLVIFLQQVAGYDALQAGLATLPTTGIMFLLSKRFGALADRLGARWFMGFGPLVGAAGLALMLRVDAQFSYWTDLLPALLVFSLGLAMTVAPLTATVLADADESNAGIASAVNNAIARVAGLLATASIGAVVGSASGIDTDGFHMGILIAAVLVAIGGLLGLAGIRDRKAAGEPCRDVRAEDCPGGQLAGVPEDAARPLVVAEVRLPAGAGAGGGTT